MRWCLWQLLLLRMSLFVFAVRRRERATSARHLRSSAQARRVRRRVLRASPQCGRCPHPIVVNGLNAQPDAAGMYMHCRANVYHI